MFLSGSVANLTVRIISVLITVRAPLLVLFPADDDFGDDDDDDDNYNLSGHQRASTPADSIPCFNDDDHHQMMILVMI